MAGPYVEEKSGNMPNDSYSKLLIFLTNQKNEERLASIAFLNIYQ